MRTRSRPGPPVEFLRDPPMAPQQIQDRLWNKFARPQVRPRYALGFEDTWWIDQEKQAALPKKKRAAIKGPMGALYHPQTAAGHSHADRHCHGQFFYYPGGARGPSGPDDFQNAGARFRHHGAGIWCGEDGISTDGPQGETAPTGVPRAWIRR